MTSLLLNESATVKYPDPRCFGTLRFGRVEITMKLHFQKLFMVCMIILHCVYAGFPDRPQYRNLYKKLSKDVLARYNSREKREGPSEEQF